jgi:pimeloyl-ACP methyl ester carboxylesterase
VVANVPFVGTPSQVGPDSFAKLAAGVRGAKINPEGAIGPLLVVNEPGKAGHAVMPQDDAAEWFLAAGRARPARWRNEVWLAAPATTADYNPAAALAHLQGPALFVVAEADLQASPIAAQEAFGLAPKGSELLMVPGHHFLPYVGDGIVRASTAARDFFVRQL